MSFAARSISSAALAAALAASCGSGDEGEGAAREALPEQNQRLEVSWNERLSVPPPQEPLALTAEQDAAAAALCAELAGAALPALGPALARARSLGAAAVPRLARLLEENSDAGTRVNAVLALTATGDARAAAPLCGVLHRQPPQVALLAARGLGQLRVPWTLPRLIKVIGRYDVTNDLIVRVEAAAALQRFGNYSGVPFLIKVLKEHTALQEDGEREWARQVRVAFEKEAALRALAQVIGDDYGFSPNASYRRQEEAIRRIEAWWHEQRLALWNASPPLEDPPLVERIGWLVDGLTVYQISTVDNARYILQALGPAVLPLLTGRLADERVYVRVHVLEVIEQIGDLLAPRADEVLAVVAPLLADGSPAVRAQAGRALGALGVKRAAPLLVPLVQDADPSVRVAGIQALGRAGGEDALAALLPLAGAAQHDDAWASASAALYTLGRREFIEPLLQDLLDGDLGRQARALEVLGGLGAPVAEFPLGGSLEARAGAARLIRATLQAR